MAGGDDGDIDRARPLLEAMGRTIVRCGPVGHGQLVKLLNNAVAVANALDRRPGARRGPRARRRPRRARRASCAPAPAASAMLELKARPFLDARLLDAVQDRAHAEGRAPLPRRARRAPAPVPGRRGAPPRCSPRRSTRGHGDEDYASMLEVVEERAENAPVGRAAVYRIRLGGLERSSPRASRLSGRPGRAAARSARADRSARATTACVRRRSWTNRAAGWSFCASTCANPRASCGISRSSRKKPCQMSLDPTNIRTRTPPAHR